MTKPDQIPDAQIVWQENRTQMGITANVRVLHLNSKFYFDGDGHGFSHSVGPYRREIHGDMDWDGVIGQIAGKDVHLWIRIRNWRFARGVLTCDLTLWGAWGNSPWLPPGGSHFKVIGRVSPFTSASELFDFLSGELGPILDDRGLLEEEEDPPALAA